MGPQRPERAPPASRRPQIPPRALAPGALARSGLRPPMPVRLVFLSLLCSGPSYPPHPLPGELQLTFRSSAQKPTWLGRPDTVGVTDKSSAKGANVPTGLMVPATVLPGTCHCRRGNRGAQRV